MLNILSASPYPKLIKKAIVQPDTMIKMVE